MNKKVQATLYSESLYKEAVAICLQQEKFDKVTRAWAFWAMSIMSFGSQIDDKVHFSYSVRCRQRKEHTLQNKKINFDGVAARLENTCIRCADALAILQKYDYEKAFFYIDPPYVGANQGRYKGYKQSDFDELLNILVSLKGSLIDSLSSPIIL